jgi:ubiquinone/menaquinone biosynthesis C-methylase UbiE
LDIEKFKQGQSAVWGLGDYEWLSRILRPAAEALCDACAVSAGQEVLDVAAGDGNFALAAAREGAAAMASDISPGMVERGRERARAEGYDVEWLVADVEELPFGDGRFDCVGSVFGAMIAPRPELAARELFRVVRPGGTVGMTAWKREGFAHEMFEVGRKYAPRPDDLPGAEEWADEATVEQRFDGLAASIEFEVRTIDWGAESPERLLQLLSESAPPNVAARKNLPPDQYEAMQAELLELFRSRAGDGHDGVAIPAEYLQTVARKRESRKQPARPAARGRS